MSLVTYTGKVFDYTNITKDSICINDIIHSLPRINRFLGHSERAYSVGEHLINCLNIANKLEFSPRLKFLTLVHDFPEAYTGDCPTPLKSILQEFKNIENQVEKSFYEYLEIEPPTKEEHLLVKAIDVTMLAIEMRDLTVHDYKSYIYDITLLDFLNDPDYQIGMIPYEENELKEILHNEFNKLYKKIK